MDDSGFGTQALSVFVKRARGLIALLPALVAAARRTGPEGPEARNS